MNDLVTTTLATIIELLAVLVGIWIVHEIDLWLHPEDYKKNDDEDDEDDDSHD